MTGSILNRTYFYVSLLDIHRPVQVQIIKIQMYTYIYAYIQDMLPIKYIQVYLHTYTMYI